jgi:ketosteroid isomerase-like protein
MSTNPTEVIKELLENTAPDKVEAAASRLVAEDLTYVSLNFDNPELKRILPWTGTSKGQYTLSDTFKRVARFWTIEGFSVASLFGDGEDVAAFGEFTYRSNTTGKAFRSPFAIHAKVRDGKIASFLFMEDTFASARSFSTGGTWTVNTELQAEPYEV